MANSALITLSTEGTPLFAGGAPSGAPPDSQLVVSPDRLLTWLALGPALIDLLEGGGLVLLARGEGDHALPEAAVADLGWHAVRGVKPDAGRGVGDLGNAARGLVAVLRDVEVLVRRDEASVAWPGPGAAEGRILSNRLEHLRHVGVALGEECRTVTTTFDRVKRTLGERKDTKVGVDLRPDRLGEETFLGHEVALLVQEASRRCGEHRVGRRLEGRGDDRLGSSEDVALGQSDLGVGVEGRLDRRVLELGLAGNPLVVDIGSGLLEHKLLDPVGAGPAARGPRLQPDAPRCRARGLDLVAEGHQLVDGRGDLVARRRECRLVVEHQALDVDVHRGAIVLVTDGR